MQKQKEKKLPGVFELLNDALALYCKQGRTLLCIMLLPIGLDLILTWLHVNSVLTVIISILVSSWAFLTILFTIKDGGGIIENYKQSLPKLPAYIYINILIAVATIPGFFLLGLPAVIYFAWFSFAVYVMVTENYFGPEALMRSREYVTHRFGRVTGRVLFIIVIMLAVQMVSFLLVQVINSTGRLPAGSLNFIRAIILNIFSLFTVPLSIAYTYALYLSLRATRPALAKQPVNADYKWLYIASPTTILVVILALVGIILGLLAKI